MLLHLLPVLLPALTLASTLTPPTDPVCPNVCTDLFCGWYMYDFIYTECCYADADVCTYTVTFGLKNDQVDYCMECCGTGDVCDDSELPTFACKPVEKGVEGAKAVFTYDPNEGVVTIRDNWWCENIDDG